MKKCLFLMSKFHQKSSILGDFRLFSAYFMNFRAKIIDFRVILGIFWQYFMIFHENMPGIYPRKIIKMFRILMFFEVFYEIFQE